MKTQAGSTCSSAVFAVARALVSPYRQAMHFTERI